MFQIDPLSRKPIYEQLIEQCEAFIQSGLLKEGDLIPSVRSLSMDLSVNPNTIQKAFADLSTRGIIRSVPGKGNVVCGNAAQIISDKNREELDEFLSLLRLLAGSGIPREELIEYVNKAYQSHF